MGFGRLAIGVNVDMADEIDDVITAGSVRSGTVAGFADSPLDDA
jgi:hypothetical protein